MPNWIVPISAYDRYRRRQQEPPTETPAPPAQEVPKPTLPPIPAAPPSGMPEPPPTGPLAMLPQPTTGGAPVPPMGAPGPDWTSIDAGSLDLTGGPLGAMGGAPGGAAPGGPPPPIAGGLPPTGQEMDLFGQPSLGEPPPALPPIGPGLPPPLPPLSAGISPPSPLAPPGGISVPRAPDTQQTDPHWLGTVLGTAMRESQQPAAPPIVGPRPSELYTSPEPPRLPPSPLPEISPPLGGLPGGLSGAIEPPAPLPGPAIGPTTPVGATTLPTTPDTRPAWGEGNLDTMLDVISGARGGRSAWAESLRQARAQEPVQPLRTAEAFGRGLATTEPVPTLEDLSGQLGIPQGPVPADKLIAHGLAGLGGVNPIQRAALELLLGQLPLTSIIGTGALGATTVPPVPLPGLTALSRATPAARTAPTVARAAAQRIAPEELRQIAARLAGLSIPLDLARSQIAGRIHGDDISAADERLADALERAGEVGTGALGTAMSVLPLPIQGPLGGLLDIVSRPQQALYHGYAEDIAQRRAGADIQDPANANRVFAAIWKGLTAPEDYLSGTELIRRAGGTGSRTGDIALGTLADVLVDPLNLWPGDLAVKVTGGAGGLVRKGVRKVPVLGAIERGAEELFVPRATIKEYSPELADRMYDLNVLRRTFPAIAGPEVNAFIDSLHLRPEVKNVLDKIVESTTEHPGTVMPPPDWPPPGWTNLADVGAGWKPPKVTKTVEKDGKTITTTMDDPNAKKPEWFVPKDILTPAAIDVAVPDPQLRAALDKIMASISGQPGTTALDWAEVAQWTDAQRAAAAAPFKRQVDALRRQAVSHQFSRLEELARKQLDTELHELGVEGLLTPETARQVGDEVRRWIEENITEPEKAAGIDRIYSGVVNNYYPRKREMPADNLQGRIWSALTGRNADVTLGGFEKHRTFETRVAGEQAGMIYQKPVQTLIDRYGASLMARESMELTTDLITGRVKAADGTAIVQPVRFRLADTAPAETVDFVTRLGNRERAGFLGGVSDDEAARIIERADAAEQAFLRDIRSSKHVIAEVPDGFTEFSKFDFLKGFAAPTELVDSIERYYEAFVNPTAARGLLDLIRGGTDVWKAMQTVFFLAFHERNGVGNIWNMHLDGFKDPRYLARAADLQIYKAGFQPKGLMSGDTVVVKAGALPSGELTADELIAVALRSGLLQGGYSAADLAFRQGPIERIRSGIGMWQEGQRVAGAAKIATSPLFYGPALGQAIEENAKLAHLMWRLESGDDIRTAVRRVRKVLFDYGDLTPFERDTMRLIQPFWTWSRKNIPYQLEHVIRNPAKVNEINKIGTFVQNIVAEGDQLSEDELAAMRVNAPWVGRDTIALFAGRDPETDDPIIVWQTGLPIEDLQRLWRGSKGRTVERWFADLHPAARLIEMVLNHSAFTGMAIDDPSYQNFYRKAWPILKDMKIGDVNMGQLVDMQETKVWKYDVNKKDYVEKTYYTADPRKMFLLMAVIGRFGSTMAEATHPEKSSFERALGLSTGIRTTRIDPTRDVSVASIDLDDIRQKYAEKLEALAQDFEKPDGISGPAWRARRSELLRAQAAEIGNIEDRIRRDRRYQELPEAQRQALLHGEERALSEYESLAPEAFGNDLKRFYAARAKYLDDHPEIVPLVKGKQEARIRNLERLAGTAGKLEREYLIAQGQFEQYLALAKYVSMTPEEWDHGARVHEKLRSLLEGPKYGPQYVNTMSIRDSARRARLRKSIRYDALADLEKTDPDGVRAYLNREDALTKNTAEARVFREARAKFVVNSPAFRKFYRERTALDEELIREGSG